MKRINAFLIVFTSYYSHRKIPIWIYDIIESDLFPIKFEYKQRGYKGLRFSAIESEIEY